VIRRHAETLRARLLRSTVRPLLLGLALGLVAAGSAGAQIRLREPSPTEPVLLTADNVSYDQELGVATASGNVEVTQGKQVLRADSVSVNERQNTVIASGNVVLMSDSGEVVFVDYFELAENMRDGVARNIRMRLGDQSRVAAVSGRRVDGRVTSMRKVVYSPCEPCADDPTRAPVWQIKADKVIHDNEQHRLVYNDAWMEMFGVPVFYTPYFSHFDSTVRRASGLLAPTIGNSSVLGSFISTPYFGVLGPSSDITVEPIFYTNDRPVLQLEYRQRFESGAMLLQGSVTPSRGRDANNDLTGETEWRGHFKADGRFEIDDDWRWGFNLARASDDTYLQRYKLLDRNGFLGTASLTSRVFAEAFRGRNYIGINTYAFQDLRPGIATGLDPFVVPMVDYDHVGLPDGWGGRFSLDANMLAIHRTEGTRDQRGLLRAGYLLPYTDSWGSSYTFEASVLGQIYNTSKIGSAADPFRPTEEGFQSRVFPQFSATWRYPLINRGENLRTIIEPVVQVVAAPDMGNQAIFPNEDSRAVDFDETSLFRLNRFAGYDRLDGGTRISYGFNIDVSGTAGGRGSLFLGHSYSLTDNAAFPSGSGLDRNQSNLVGKATFAPHPWVQASYSFQIDPQDAFLSRSVAGAIIGPTSFQFSAYHLFIDKRGQPDLPNDLSQLALGAIARIDENWRVQGRTLTNVGASSGLLLGGLTVVYEDECLVAALDFSRRNLSDRDNPQDTTVSLRLTFRNLGQLITNLPQF
jgi:LPS-assembly protein